MKQAYHVVLGGAGAVGQAVIDVLLAQGRKVVAVERKKKLKALRQLRQTCSIKKRASTQSLERAMFMFV